MRVNVRFKMSLLVLALSSMPFAVSAQIYSFQQSVEKTLAQNPAINTSNYKLQQARFALAEANHSKKPQITLSAIASNSNNALNVFGMKLRQRNATFRDFGFADMARGVDHAPSDLNNPGSYSDFSTKVEVLVPVWNGGKTASYQNQAKAMIQAAKHGDKALQQFLVFNVYQAYETVHTAQAFVLVAKQALKAAESYVKTTKSLVRQGMVVKSELLSAEVSSSQASSSLELARTKVLIAKDSLRSLMFIDANAPFTIGERKNLSLPSQNLNDLIQLALLENPTIKATREVARSSKSKVDAVNAANYPSFNVMLAGETSDKSLGFDSTSYTIAGVVSWKLTDFGVTASRVDRANALANEKQAQIAVKKNQIELEVLKAWRMLNVAKQRIVSNQLAVQQAEEAQRLVLRRHKNGIATMTEVLANQTQLDKTRADLVSTEFEINLQKANLRLATGTMSLEHIL